ncbi:hypothetical protein L207DRAFT_544765 [Hyaloscypha variabilis F]|uniref:Uncharacterized protein n=1 Tax=Hyaloscypha variabilis (strain UAMH 11265 / GT02V1 / F) TaxID=1149755 RepID=A0A2J6RJK4_HYAVF|nr:hypothetical protein L207DRAFT_544765 [Hyaloscypha variabilis F]
MDGTEDSKALCFIEHDDVYLVAGGYERACWLKLLGKAQNSISNLGASSEALKGCQLPILQFQENSWDFQLPDVVRPLAKISVGTIAVIARRLGMRWKEFDPIHGIMRAEGNGQTIIATTIRSLGTVIQYNSWDQRRSQERYIPVMEADRLGFGIISSMYMFLDGLCLGTREQVLATLRTLEPSGHCVAILQTLYKQDPNYNLRMGSSVAILADMIRPKNMILTQVPAPCENALGFTQDSHGRYVFRKFLEEYCKSREVGRETKWVLQGIQTYSVFFQEKTPTAVLSAHIRFGIFRDHGETSLLTSRSPDYDSEIAGYFDAWPNMAKALAAESRNSSKRGLEGEHQTSEELERHFFGLWVRMLFRGCLWGACHEFVPGERVPSEWWGSEMPIYIG